MGSFVDEACVLDRELAQQIEEITGGTVEALEREGRWRSAWQARIAHPDGPRTLVVRGERAEGNDLSLEDEAAIHGLLEAHGVPVPHVYGLTERPRAMVMDHLRGVGQLSGISDPQDQRAMIDEYMTHLVRIHRIPLDAVAAAGIAVPSGPEDGQLALFRRRRRKFLAAKARPEPLIAFASRWVLRTVPTHRDRMTLAVKDAGQFLQERGSITGLYDLELAHVTDPQADLSGLRVRNAFEPLGDLAHVFAKYEELSGDPIDPAAVNFHQVVGGLAGRQAITRLRAEARADYVTWLTWEVAGAFSILSAIAEELGERLDPAPPAFEETQESLGGSLGAALAGWSPPDGVYERTTTADVIGHLQLVLRRGRSLVDGHLDDVASLVGHRARDAAEADADLEAFVEEAGPENDSRILHVLHRCAQRQQLLLPAMEPEGRPPGSVGPFVEGFHLEPVRSVVARMRR